MWHNDNCTVCHYGKTTNNELGGSCEACPAGKISTVDLGGTRCFDCPNEDACLGYGYHNCSEGYEGNLCGSCISGYYALGKTCNKCAKTPIITIIGVSIAIILGWALSKIELSFHHLIRLKIYSTFAQLMRTLVWVTVITTAARVTRGTCVGVVSRATTPWEKPAINAQKRRS